jgi:hypothetical protein
LALLVLIGAAAYLAYSASKLSEEVQEAPRRPKPRGKTAQTGDIATYTNAIASLQTPPLWDASPVDPFHTERVKKGPDIVTPPPPTPGEPVSLIRIVRQPFRLIFKSYTGEGEHIGINFLTRSRTFFVDKVGMKIADKFYDTGYLIIKFDQKFIDVFNAATGSTNKVDVSELTIQHAGEDPIRLVLNKITEEKEPVAVAQCAEGGNAFNLHRQQEFDCAGKTWIVVDITSTQLIIMDKLSKEKHTISLNAVGR